MGRPAEDVLFIDDSPANVEGARRVGLAAHLFVGPAQLEATLAAAGLLG